MIEIKKVTSGKQKKQFADLPYKLYKNSEFWVPMFYKDAMNIVNSKGSQLLETGEHGFFLAYKDDIPVGRIGVGIDRVINKSKEFNHAYFTLFESINDHDVADALIHAAEDWAREKGMLYLQGPVSPTNGDDYRGFLKVGYDKMPGIMMPYTHAYYHDFFEDCDNYLEYNAYTYHLDDAINRKSRRLLETLLKREEEFSDVDVEEFNDEKLSDEVCKLYTGKFHFTLEKGRLKTTEDLERCTKYVYTVMKNAYPEYWEEDLLPPTEEELRGIILELKKVIKPELALFAMYEGKPVSFGMVIPDLSEGIQKSEGKLLPFKWVHLLQSKKNTKKGRAGMFYVDREFQKQGLPIFMLLSFKNSLKYLGYTNVEISSISSLNKDMNSVLRWFSELDKRYILYGKNLTDRKLTLKEIRGNVAEKNPGRLRKAHPNL